MINVLTAGALSRASAVVFFVAAAAACDPARARDLNRDAGAADSIARVRQDSLNRAQPGYVVDSIRPVAEELSRFRDAIGGEPARAFTGGSRSMDALIARFVAAVGARDTAEFRQMAVTAREFADLVYPTSPFVHPPYRQSPGLVWFQTQIASSSGLTRLIARRGGRALGVVGHTCQNPPEVQGANRIWDWCTLQTRGADSVVRNERLHGAIVERNGVYKFVSYANRL